MFSFSFKDIPENGSFADKEKIIVEILKHITKK